MASTVINFTKPDVQPPVFVAGGFTDWSPVEMECEPLQGAESGQNRFVYRLEVQPGKYQYKFRLGPGDWWACDESTPTEDDGAGNVNNVLVVESMDSTVPPAQPEPEQDVLAAPASQTTDETPDPFIQSQPEPEQTETLTTPETLVEKAEVVVEDHIPDIAPPPYSVEEHEHIAIPGSLPADAEPTQASAPVDSKLTMSGTTKEGRPSWLSRNVLLVAAAVIIPVAISYAIRR